MQQQEHRRMHEVESRHFWFVGTRRVILDRLRAALGSGLPRAQVLDLGCGTGYTLSLLDSVGGRVGLDASSEALRLAGSRAPGTRWVTGDATRLPFASSSFDAVLALDVLEHLDDDRAAAREIARVLRPGGVCVATVPAFSWLWSGHDARLEHRRRYRRPEFSRLLGGAGLRVEQVSYYNFWLFPLIATLRLIARARERNTGGGQGDDLAIPPGPLNRLLTAVLASERLLLRFASLPFGVSCIAVASKPD